MSDVPFGFGSHDPRDPDRRDSPGEGGSPDPANPFAAFGAGGFDVGALGQMLTQLGQMLSQGAAGGGGPVNYDLAKQMALQKLSTTGLPSAQQAAAIADAVRLAELWLDPATVLPAGTHSSAAWAPRDWVEKTLPTWQRLCDPVARRMAGSWIDALPDEVRQTAGPLVAMVEQMGGMAFGSQLGSALAQLGGEVLTSTDIGLPLGPLGLAALLPAAIERFATGLERKSSEVIVFLAAREVAHHRLFGHVPWLRQRLLATVEEFARGIQVDTEALQELARQVDPTDPQSMDQLISSDLLEAAAQPGAKGRPEPAGNTACAGGGLGRRRRRGRVERATPRFGCAAGNAATAARLRRPGRACLRHAGRLGAAATQASRCRWIVANAHRSARCRGPRRLVAPPGSAAHGRGAERSRRVRRPGRQARR